MGFFSAGKKTTTSNFLGFLQSDVDKFIKQGSNLSSNNLSNLVAPTQQVIRRETLSQSSKGPFSSGFSKGVSTKEQLVSESAVANLSQDQLNAFVSAFVARTSGIRNRTRAPGRERLFIRE